MGWLEYDEYWNNPQIMVGQFDTFDMPLTELHWRKRARDQLIDLTRDPVERIRNAAGAALAALGDAAALPALESLKGRQPAQDAPSIERWAQKLRKGAPGEETRKLREQVEKLEERCRKLDERIQDVEADKAKGAEDAQ